jgi:ABC-type dipeptide/oligopeptide/nickel transport system permease subunit
MGVCTMVVFVMGVSRGMVIAYLERTTIDNILEKIIKKTDDDDETL